MRLSLILLAVASIFALHSCKPETVEDAKNLSLEKDFDLIEVDANYQIKILDYMNTTDILNDEASLQYMYAFKEEFIIVIDEPKQEFINSYLELNSYDKNKTALSNYSNVQLAYLDEVMKPIRRTQPKPLAINNLAINYIEMDATIAEVNEDASYFIYYIEGKKNIYTIMAWTLIKNKNIYREKVKKMIKTFKEVN